MQIKHSCLRDHVIVCGSIYKSSCLPVRLLLCVHLCMYMHAFLCNACLHVYMHACMYTCMFAFMIARNTLSACTFPESDERAVYVLMYAFLRVSTYVFARDCGIYTDSCWWQSPAFAHLDHAAAFYADSVVLLSWLNRTYTQEYRRNPISCIFL